MIKTKYEFLLRNQGYPFSKQLCANVQALRNLPGKSFHGFQQSSAAKLKLNLLLGADSKDSIILPAKTVNQLAFVQRNFSNWQIRLFEFRIYTFCGLYFTLHPRVARLGG